MNHLIKKYNRVKDFLSLPWFTTTLLLLAVVIALFNLNFDAFWAEAQQGETVSGEGSVGFIPKYIETPIDLTTVTIEADDSILYTGDETCVTWSSTNATSCTGVNFDTGGATAGSFCAAPGSSITYSVTCTGVSVASSNTTVTVKKKPKFIEN